MSTKTEMLMGFCALILVAAAFITAVTCLVNFGSMMTDNSHCVVKDNNTVWFEGPAYQVNCTSLGATTKCTVNGGGVFTMIFSNRHIVGNNIIIDCK